MENIKDSAEKNTEITESPKKADLKKVLTIFFIMFRMGCITYGGGWSILAQMEEEFAEKKDWLTKEELLDFMSIARSFPGIMVINLSVQTGYRMAGIPGSLAAAFGLASPAFITLSIITYCYETLVANQWVARALVGVRCAVVPIILMATIKMKKMALKGKIAWVLAILSLVICLFTGMNKLLMVIIAAVFGILVYGIILPYREKNRKTKEDPSC